MNVAKFGAGGVGKMMDHYTRAQDEEGNYKTYPHSEGGAGHIHRERTEENYTLGEIHDEKWISERLEGVYQKPGQKDPVKMCDIVLTLPKSEDPTNARKFFEAGYQALSKMYGQHENVVGAWVHMDEAQPHMHFAFLPISHRQSKQKPQFKEKLSTRAYWPKKSSLQEMHRTMQKELDQTLGRHVEITFERSKDRDAYNRLGINELKAMTEKMENGRTEAAKQAAIRRERGGMLKKKEVYYEVPEKAFAILSAAARAAEMAKDEARTAEKREKVANERAAKAEAAQETAQADRIKLAQEAAIYLDAPAEVKTVLENVRRQHIANQRNLQRDCVRVFLSSGRDFEKALQKMRPTLEKIGITKPADQRSYMKKSLSATIHQLKKEYKIDKATKEVTERKKNVPARHDSPRGGGSSGGGGASWSADHASTDYLHSAGTTGAVALGGRLDEGHEEVGPWSMLSEMAKADKNVEELIKSI